MAVSDIAGSPISFPTEQTVEIDLAIGEAWAWLEREGLLIPAPDTNGRNGWRVLSRRARSYAQDVNTSRRAAPIQFPKELLHTRILEKAWRAYMRTDFNNAAFEARSQSKLQCVTPLAMAPKRSALI